MTKEEGLFVAAVLALFVVLFVHLFISIRSMQRDLDKLAKRTQDCVSETLFRLEQGQRRDLDKKVDAMQECLGLEITTQPQRTVATKKESAA